MTNNPYRQGGSLKRCIKQLFITITLRIKYSWYLYARQMAWLRWKFLCPLEKRLKEKCAGDIDEK
jgi:hypothetical protein